MGDIVPDGLEAYVEARVAARDPALAAVEAQGRREGWPIVGPAEGTLLHLLTRLVRARRALELGTAIGYSTTWIARALEPGGELVTVEWDPDTANLAAENLKRTGVADRVRILVGDAREIVEDLAGPFDLVFNDIDKVAYPAVLPHVANRLRVGGLLVTDNVLWGGSVAKGRADAPTRAKIVLTKGNDATKRSAIGRSTRPVCWNTSSHSIAPSTGSAPAWLATRIAAPDAGTCSAPWDATRK